MDHALFAGQDLYESPDRNDPCDGSAEHFPLVYFAGESFDDALGCLCSSPVMRSNRDDATVFNVDLGVRAFCDALDCATSRANHCADQFWIDSEAQQARGMGREGSSGSVDGFQHLLEDVDPGRAGLIDSFCNGFDRKAGDLHVHLQGRDAIFCSSHLEVHITEEVLDSLDVSEDANLSIFLDQAHGGSADWSLQWNTCIHEGQGAAADRAHRGGPIGAEDFAHHPEHVREGVLGRQYWNDGAFSEGTMAYLTAPGRSHWTCLANGIGGEVVVV